MLYTVGMTTTQNHIPADHLAKLQTATDEQLRHIQEHNQKRASQDWAAGRHDDARRWYAYVDTCQAILDERHHGAPTPAATPMVTDRQVTYITRLLVQRIRSGEGSGFSGLVNGLTRGGQVDTDAIRALTRKQASEVIDSLTGRY